MKVPILTVSSALVKICQIPHVSFSKPQVCFSSNFALFFSVIKDNSSVLFQVKFYIISTKGAYQSANLVKFYMNSQKSEMLHFDGLLLSKSCTVSAKKVQKSYLSWHWRVMQSLEKNWLGSFKHDIRNLVNFHPNIQKSENCFLPKV